MCAPPDDVERWNLARHILAARERDAWAALQSLLAKPGADQNGIDAARKEWIAAEELRYRLEPGETGKIDEILANVPASGHAISCGGKCLRDVKTCPSLRAIANAITLDLPPPTSAWNRQISNGDA